VASPKITDLVTTVETEIVQSQNGPVVWGAVEICYSAEGLEPRVSIRVPVPAYENQSDEQRRSEALRRARKLIDHACGAIQPSEEPPQDIPEMLTGIAQELGLMPPTKSPKPVSKQAR